MNLDKNVGTISACCDVSPISTFNWCRADTSYGFSSPSTCCGFSVLFYNSISKFWAVANGWWWGFNMFKSLHHESLHWDAMQEFHQKEVKCTWSLSLRSNCYWTQLFLVCRSLRPRGTKRWATSLEEPLASSPIRVRGILLNPKYRTKGPNFFV